VGGVALEAVAAHDPDVCVFDVTMPGMDGVQALQALRRRGDGRPVVLLTAQIDDNRLLDALEAEVNGIVTKEGAEETLLETLDAVLAGLYWKAGGEQVETLLFGLFDDAGLLHYVGRVPVHGEEADKAKQIVAPLLGGSGFTGKTPGGKSRWSHEIGQGASAGVMTTASGLTFTGDAYGNFLALDTSDGKTLWHANGGSGISSSPITYELDGQQYLVTSAGSVMYAWRLPTPPAP